MNARQMVVDSLPIAALCRVIFFFYVSSCRCSQSSAGLRSDSMAQRSNVNWTAHEWSFKCLRYKVLLWYPIPFTPKRVSVLLLSVGYHSSSRGMHVCASNATVYGSRSAELCNLEYFFFGGRFLWKIISHVGSFSLIMNLWVFPIMVDVLAECQTAISILQSLINSVVTRQSSNVDAM